MLLLLVLGYEKELTKMHTNMHTIMHRPRHVLREESGQRKSCTLRCWSVPTHAARP